MFQQRLEESQRTAIRYGFRNEQWLIKHHGQRKAEKIMERKKNLGLNLGSHIYIESFRKPTLEISNVIVP